MEKLIQIGCVGDLILHEPGPMEPYFEDSKEDLKTIDVLIGQVETPHTNRAQPSCIDVQAPPSPPENLNVLRELGFDIATLAGNHAYDCGPFGVIDTIARLRELGIQPCGAGANIVEAKSPAIVEKEGIKVGVIDYNSVGPSLGWAMSTKAGCAYVDILTLYRSMDMPAYPPRVYTFVEPDSKKLMQADVAKLKAQCDIAVVVYHKGLGGRGPDLAMYEFEMTRAAIDAGADIVFAHHAHMLKAIELYKDKPIFHGLGNFVTVTYALTPGMHHTTEKEKYLREREKQGRGLLEFDPPYYPWTEETLDTMIAAVTVSKAGIREISFLPYRIDKTAVPRKLSKTSGGQELLDNVISLTRSVGLETGFSWSEDGLRVIVKKESL